MRLPPIRIRVEEPALAAVYDDREPFHWTGTRAPLSGVSVFGNEAGPHWHYVSFGLRPALGVELTFRLAADRVDDPSAAPAWPVRLLEKFARHATQRGRSFEPGHYLCLPEPVDPDRAVRCGALVRDPQLGAAREAQWLQIVGLHDDELPWMSGDGYPRLLGALARRDPLLVTVPRRAPIALG